MRPSSSGIDIGRSFELAVDKGADSIAFAAINTGVCSYPKPQAASVAIRVMMESIDEVGRIVACCFNDEDAAVYHESLSLLQSARE